MIINENLSLSAVITSEVNGVDTPIVSLNCGLNGNNFNINCSIINEEQVELNKVDVQTQMNSFMETVRAKMLEKGYSITI